MKAPGKEEQEVLNPQAVTWANTVREDIQNMSRSTVSLEVERVSSFASNLF